MNVLHLIWIIPLSVLLGFAACAISAASKEESEDVEKVTRCMKCKSYDPDNSECTIKFDRDGERLTVPPDYYCADGKRRKDHCSDYEKIY